jgi:hypothetical protein
MKRRLKFKKIRKLLRSKTLQPFISIENGGLRLHDVRVAQLAAA